MSAVMELSGRKIMAFLVMMILMTLFGAAMLVKIRTSVAELEGRATRLDSRIASLSEDLRGADRELTALTAPMGVYTLAAEQFGMQQTALAGVVRLDGAADGSVLSASLPRSLGQN